ncbi:hypothetical protein CK507_17680 [Pseudomonas sp. WN033]|nr:hypothetical protein CK507_17680 [Pseudomonas sp. WN033]
MVGLLMPALRACLGALLVTLLLSFNTLAATLLAAQACLVDEPVMMHGLHEDCADIGTADWLSSTAELLCDSGLDCQLSAAALVGGGQLSGILPKNTLVPATHAGASPAMNYPLWRPPRH